MAEQAVHRYRPVGSAVELFNDRGPEILMSGPAGTGKSQPLDAIVQTPAGPRHMGDITVGDTVLGAAGQPVKVMAVPFRGRAPVWRLTLTGGETVECSDGHLWQTNHGVLSVAAMLGAGLRDRRDRRRYWIPQPGPAEYDEQPVPIAPYTLGVLLGDGYLRPGEVSFTTADQQMEDRVASEVAPRYKIVTSEKSGNAAWNVRIVSSDARKPRRASTAKRGYVSRTMSGKWMARAREEGHRADQAVYIGSYDTPAAAQAALDTLPPIVDAGDSIHGDIDALGLRNARSATKFVPDVYKHNTPAVRLSVLQGLMDTDGYAGKTEVSFCSISRQLAADVQWLAESLGGVATITTKQPAAGQLAYQVWLRMPDPAAVFHLDRKRARTSARRSPIRRYVEHAEPAGEQECQCITVDADDGLYLTGRFVVTHNSRACLEKMHTMALANPGLRGLICRKTAVSLGSTALVTFREHVAKEALASGEVRWYGGSAQEAASYRYGNGSVIVVGGMDKASRIMSSEYDVCYVQEATELVEDDWEAITTRLRNGRVSFQQIMADCNPDAPHHWLRQRCERGACRMIVCTHQDNPRLYDPENGAWSPEGTQYINRLDALTGVRYERLRLGKWAAAEGLIYDTFDPAVHMHKPIGHPPDTWTRWWSVDFGFTNPFSWQAWAEDPDGRLYLYREIYMTQRLVEDHAATIKAVTRTQHGREPEPRSVTCDHDAEGRATLERELGISTVPAHKSVLEGIEAVKARLKVQPDGRPRLYICRDALVERDPVLVEAKKPLNTESEMLEYVWDDKSKKEQPRKDNDHGMDALRYRIADSDLAGRPRIRVLAMRLPAPPQRGQLVDAAVEQRTVRDPDTRYPVRVGELPQPVRLSGFRAAVRRDPIDRRQPVPGGVVGAGIVPRVITEPSVDRVGPLDPPGLLGTGALLDIREQLLTRPHPAEQLDQRAGLHSRVLPGGDIRVDPGEPRAADVQRRPPRPAVPGGVGPGAVQRADHDRFRPRQVRGVGDIRLEL